MRQQDRREVVLGARSEELEEEPEHRIPHDEQMTARRLQHEPQRRVVDDTKETEKVVVAEVVVDDRVEGDRRQRDGREAQDPDLHLSRGRRA